MLQLTPVAPSAAGQFNTLAAAGGLDPTQVRQMLRHAGLERHCDAFLLRGLDSPEAIMRMSVQDMEALGIKPADQPRLLHSAQEWHQRRSNLQQQQQPGQVTPGTYMMPFGSIRGGVPVQAVMVNGYGQLISVSGPAAQPDFASLGMPWPQAGDTGPPQLAVPFAPVPPFPFHAA
jgi:hypothetical protein